MAKAPTSKAPTSKALAVPAELWSDVAEQLIVLPSGSGALARPEAVRNAALASTKVTDRLTLMQGELLREIRDKKYFITWGFPTFEEYIENELSFRRRKAYYLIKIFEKFIVELGLDKKTLADLEWSKAKELLPIITKENWKDMLDATKDMSVSQVQAFVKEMLSDGDEEASSAGSDTDGEEEFTKMEFTLAAIQRENVNQALEMARAMTGSKKMGNLLDLIATDFCANKVTEGEKVTGEEALVRIDHHLKALERTFGVTLEVTAVADMPAYKALEDGEKAEEPAEEAASEAPAEAAPAEEAGK